MNRRDRKAAVAKAKAEGMNRRDRKALGRSLKTQSMEEKAKDNAREALLRSDDWQAVGQRKRDLIEGLKRFNESETAALLKTRPYLGPQQRQVLRGRKSDGFSSVLEYISDKYRL